MGRSKRSLWLGLAILVGQLANVGRVQAQPIPMPPMGDLIYERTTSVSFIDSAIPMPQLKIRYEENYRVQAPNRAEYLWAKSGVAGPGVPLPETGLRYQDFSVYGECPIWERVSVFFEAPFRFLNPTINQNTAGFGDANAGGKVAFISTDQCVVTAQFRVYLPFGDEDKGLGNGHMSYEPALLANIKLHPCVTLEGECRYWLASQGTDFKGDLLRSGVGLTFLQRSSQSCWVTPVAEFVSYTVLSGSKQWPSNPIPLQATSAGGDTIINAILGVRFGWCDRFDLYGGYGRALTGDAWYKDMFRVELRWLF